MRAARIFAEFLLVGCTAFGGPMAHLAWFERVFVIRLKWVSHGDLAALIALCQALPGPASSQTAMGIGYLRGGWPGFWAAWLGFTLPAAALMLAAAFGALALPQELRDGLTAGMKVAVVGIVAAALWRMGRTLLHDPSDVLKVAIYGGCFLAFPSPWVVLLLLALIVLISLREEGVCLASELRARPLGGTAMLLAAAVPGLLLLSKLAAVLAPGPWTALGAAFYQAGLLVFGGGHVVLPLLDGLVAGAGWVERNTFLFGYGMAQMVPGPLFSFAAYLGASFPVADSLRLPAGLLALLALYLPSFLLLGILLPRWRPGQQAPHWRAVLSNLHPAVIGLLLAALINPVATTAIHGWRDAAVAALAGILLARFPAITLPVLATCAAGYAYLAP